ncbi:hypothetical protein V1504DRAFT_442894 [Lipomyces starkeyi]
MNEKRALPENDLSLKLPTTPFRTTFASLSMYMRDRTRLLRFPDRDVTQIQDIIRRAWPRGIQDTRVYDAAKEVKLYGNPWSVSSWRAEKTEARRLLCQILHDTLLFRYQQPPPPSCIWMSILFDRGDLLHLIEAPQDLGRVLVQAYGEKVQIYQFKGSVFEIKFRGNPWRAYGTDTVQTRLILLTILECLEQQGFSLYASIDQDNGPGGDSHSSEADRLFCCVIFVAQLPLTEMRALILGLSGA